jgi:hypothetical protein
MRGAVPRNRGRRLGAACLGLVLLLAGCTYSDREPGLFGRTPAPETSPTDTRPTASTRDGIAAVPVLGEAIYRSTGRVDVSLRIAVHAVRRVPVGTVLDWSVTALAGPGAAPDEQLFLELGLVEEFDVSLIDPAGAKVYRPLINRRSGTCLCIPAWLVGHTMVVNSPRLLQTTFPPLPASTRMVEVNIATVPIFSRIPVTPAGQVQTAAGKSDLARPADVPPPLASTEEFRRPSGQSFVFEVESVLASGTFTSVVWTVRAVSSGPGSIGTEHPRIRRSSIGPVLRAQTATVQIASEKTRQCLCPTLGNVVDRLRDAGDQVTVVTNFPALPRGTTNVDVLFPAVDPLVGITASPAPEGAFRAGGPAPARTGTWSYIWNRPQAGWSLSRWPTPVPASIDPDRYRTTVDRLAR